MRQYDPVKIDEGNIEIAGVLGLIQPHRLLDYTTPGGIYLVSRVLDPLKWKLNKSNTGEVQAITELEIKVDEVELGRFSIAVRRTSKRLDSWYDSYKYVTARPLNLYYPNGNGPPDDIDLAIERRMNQCAVIQRSNNLNRGDSEIDRIVIFP